MEEIIELAYGQPKKRIGFKALVDLLGDAYLGGIVAYVTRNKIHNPTMQDRSERIPLTELKEAYSDVINAGFDVRP